MGRKGSAAEDTGPRRGRAAPAFYTVVQGSSTLYVVLLSVLSPFVFPFSLKVP